MTYTGNEMLVKQTSNKKESPATNHPRSTLKCEFVATKKIHPTASQNYRLSLLYLVIVFFSLGLGPQPYPHLKPPPFNPIVEKKYNLLPYHFILPLVYWTNVDRRTYKSLKIRVKVFDEFSSSLTDIL